MEIEVEIKRKAQKRVHEDNSKIERERENALHESEEIYHKKYADFESKRINNMRKQKMKKLFHQQLKKNKK